MLSFRKKFRLLVLSLFLLSFVFVSFGFSADTNLSAQKNVDSGVLAFDTNLVKDPADWEPEDSGFLWLFVKTILILGLFVFVFVMLFRYSKKNSNVGDSVGGLIDIIYSFSIGVNKKISVLKVVNVYYLISITQDNISVLTEITDKETIDRFKLEKSKNIEKQSVFRDILGNYLNMPKKSPLSFTQKLKDRMKS